MGMISITSGNHESMSEGASRPTSGSGRIEFTLRAGSESQLTDVVASLRGARAAKQSGSRGRPYAQDAALPGCREGTRVHSF